MHARTEHVQQTHTSTYYMSVRTYTHAHQPEATIPAINKSLTTVIPPYKDALKVLAESSVIFSFLCFVHHWEHDVMNMLEVAIETSV